MHPSSVWSQDRVVKQSDHEEEEGEIEVVPSLSRDEKGKKERIREASSRRRVFYRRRRACGGLTAISLRNMDRSWTDPKRFRSNPIRLSRMKSMFSYSGRSRWGSPILNSTTSFSPREKSPKEASFLLARRPPERGEGRSCGGCGKTRHLIPFVCTGM